MTTFSRQWRFDSSSASLAFEALAAYRVGRHEHYAAALTAAHRNGQHFDVIFAWATAVAVLNNPANPLIGTDRPVRVPDTFSEHAEQRTRDATAAYDALIAAAANRHRETADAMWHALERQEQSDLLYLLINNLVLALDRTSRRR